MNFPDKGFNDAHVPSTPVRRPRDGAAHRLVAATIAALPVAVAFWLSGLAEVRAPDDTAQLAGPPSPVLWFKLDEGSGTRVRDAGDSGASGEILGELPLHWLDDGIAGSALHFDPASTGYVVAPDGKSPGRFQRLTISVWVKVARGANGPVIAKWPENGDAGGYMLSIAEGHPAVEFLLEHSRVSLVAETALPSDEAWHHVAATYDGIAARLFVDGEPSGTLTVSGDLGLGDAPLLLGRNPAGQSFTGSIDDVRVYDAALNPGGIIALYNMDTDGDGVPNVLEVQRGFDPNQPNESGSKSKAGVQRSKASSALSLRQVAPVASASALSASSVANHQLRIDREGNNMRLGWRSTPGRLYRLQTRDDLLTGSWNILASLVATGNTASSLDVAPLPPKRFYRLLLPDVETSLYEPPEPAPGEPNNLSGCGAGPSEFSYAYLFSGEAHYSAVDLRIKGRGLDFIWARKYRSRLGPNTAQGNGWDFSYNIRIQRLGQDIEVFDGNTRQDIFCRQPDGTYVADQFFREGIFDGAGVFTLKFADTGTWVFRPLDGSAAQGKIDHIADRNGNTLQMQYNGSGKLVVVTDTLNRNISIGYNADGFIDTVTDFTGRQVRYSYWQNGEAGGSAGDLKSATSPIVVGTPNGNDFPVGKTTTFTYSIGAVDAPLNHNLLTVTDPLGQNWLRNEYSTVTDPTDLRYDRTVNVYWGDAADRISLDYVPQIPGVGNDFATIKIIVNDRVGNVSEYLYDGGNRCVDHRAFTGRAVPGQTTTETVNRPANPLRPADPAYFETHYQWNIDSRPTRIVYPNGNVVENTYELALDANAPRRYRGNLRTRRQLPGPLGGDQAEIVEQFEYNTGAGGCCGGDNFVTRAVDGRGNETLHNYDAHGNRTHTQHRIASIVEDWEYNTFGQMTAHVLPDNGSGSRRRDEMTYYAGGPQKGYLQGQIMDAGGFNLLQTYEYNAVGDVIRQVDPRGHDTLYLVNALDQVVRQTSREVTNGSGVRYQRDTYYNANDNVVRADIQNIDELGILQANTHFTTTFDYEILNRPIRMTQEVDPGHNVVMEYAYDANRNRTLVRNGEAVNGNQPANIVSTFYDERDLLFREIRAVGSADQSTTLSDYDTNGNLSRTSQGLESIPRNTLYTYDGYNRRIARTDPMGNVSIAHYDPNGNVVSERFDGQLNDVPGSAGNVRLSETIYTYDAMDRRTRRDVAFFNTQTQAPILDGQSTTQTFYSDNSQVARVVDDNSHNTNTTYDTANRTQTVTDAKGNAVTRAYDNNGNATTITEVDKSDLGLPDQTFITQSAYDNLDRLTQTTDNIGNTHRYGYDSRNNQTLHIDARGNTTRYAYDGLNRLIQTIQLLTDTGEGTGNVVGSITTAQEWDDDSRLTAQIDNNGNRTGYSYDALNRRIRETAADTTMQSFTFDVHGNRIQMTDANGTGVTCTYDLLDRMIGKNIAVGPGVSGNKTFEQYRYDGLGRITRAADNESVVTRGFISLSLVSVETFQILPAGPVRAVNFTYDGVGNELTCTYPGGQVINHAYDALDRNVAISGAGGPNTTYNYIGPTRVEQRDSGNGTRLQVGYDGIQRIISTAHTKIAGGQPIDFRSYQWDPMHNKAQANAFTAPPAADNLTYRYDSAGRLVHTDHATITPPPTDYFLDGVGNRTFVAGSPDPGNYSMNGGLPEPADAQMNQYSTTPFDSRTYDKNGNLVGTFSTPHSFTYDYKNQLTQFTDSGTGQTTTYKYDCFDRRIEKNAAGSIARFYYHGWQEVEEQNAANATAATFVWGNGIDELLQMTRNGLQRYYHEDDLGSIAKVTDATGNLLESYSYGDYGQPSFFDAAGTPIAQSAIGNPYLFTGRRFDPETGFYYYRTRYLDPRAGRFISRDTIGIWGDTGNLGNAYAYVGNRPASATDPFGEKDTVTNALEALNNGAAGFADTITVGIAGRVRRGIYSFFGGDGVNMRSTSYKVGEATGVAWNVAMGGAQVARAVGSGGAAAAKGAAKAMTGKATIKGAAVGRAMDITAQEGTVVAASMIGATSAWTFAQSYFR